MTSKLTAAAQKVQGNFRAMSQTAILSVREVSEALSRAQAPIKPVTVSPFQGRYFQELHAGIAATNSAFELLKRQQASSVYNIRNSMTTLARSMEVPKVQMRALADTATVLGRAFHTSIGDILGVSARLTDAGRRAGLTSRELMALTNTALSLNIGIFRSKRALDALIDSLADAEKGGAKSLAAFARSIGATDAEFAALRQGGIAAVEALISALGRIETAGGDVTKVLGDIGIKSGKFFNKTLTQDVRDIASAELRLKDSVDVANRAWGLHSDVMADNLVIVEQLNAGQEALKFATNTTTSAIGKMSEALTKELLTSMAGTSKETEALSTRLQKALGNELAKAVGNATKTVSKGMATYAQGMLGVAEPLDQIQDGFLAADKSAGSFRDRLRSLAGEARATAESMGRFAKSVYDSVDALLDLPGRVRDVVVAPISDLVHKMGMGLSTTVTAPLLAMGVGAAKAAIDFESAFAGVAKTVDGVRDSVGRLTEAGLRLQRQLRDMATREIPLTAEELSQIAEIGGQLGISLRGIEAFTRTVAMLATATNLGLEGSATAIAKISTIMGLTQREYERLGSTITLLGDRAASTETDIADMAIRLAASGKLAGLSASNIVAYATALSDIGIEAEAGGTAFSKVFQTIYEAVKTGNSELQTFATTAGLSGAAFKAAFSRDPATAINAFIQGLRRIHREGGNVFQVLRDVEFQDARLKRAITGVAEANDKLTGYLKMANDEWKTNSYLSQEAGVRWATTASMLKRLWSQVKEVGIVFGEAMAPGIRLVIRLLEHMLKVAELLARAFGLLPGPIQLVVFGFVALAAAAGPLLLLLMHLTSTFAVLFTFAKINAFLATMGGAFHVAAAGVTALRQAAQPLFDAIVTAFGPLGRVFSLIGTQMARFGRHLTSVIREGLSVGVAFRAFGNALGGTLDLLAKGIVLFMRWVGGPRLLTVALIALAASLPGVQRAFSDLLRILSAIWQIAVRHVVAAFEQLQRAMDQWGEASRRAWNWLTDNVPLFQQLSEAVSGVGRFLNSLADSLSALNEAGETSATVVNLLTVAMAALAALSVLRVINAFVRALRDLTGGAAGAIRWLFGLSTATQDVHRAMSKLGPVADIITRAWAKLVDWVRRASAAFVQWRATRAAAAATTGAEAAQIGVIGRIVGAYDRLRKAVSLTTLVEKALIPLQARLAAARGVAAAALAAQGDKSAFLTAKLRVLAAAEAATAWTVKTITKAYGELVLVSNDALFKGMEPALVNSLFRNFSTAIETIRQSWLRLRAVLAERGFFGAVALGFTHLKAAMDTQKIKEWGRWLLALPFKPILASVRLLATAIWDFAKGAWFGLIYGKMQGWLALVDRLPAGAAKLAVFQRVGLAVAATFRTMTVALVAFLGRIALLMAAIELGADLARFFGKLTLESKGLGQAFSELFDEISTGDWSIGRLVDALGLWETEAGRTKRRNQEFREEVQRLVDDFSGQKLRDEIKAVGASFEELIKRGDLTPTAMEGIRKALADLQGQAKQKGVNFETEFPWAAEILNNNVAERLQTEVDRILEEARRLKHPETPPLPTGIAFKGAAPTKPVEVDEDALRRKAKDLENFIATAAAEGHQLKTLNAEAVDLVTQHGRVFKAMKEESDPVIAAFVQLQDQLKWAKAATAAWTGEGWKLNQMLAQIPQQERAVDVAMKAAVERLMGWDKALNLIPSDYQAIIDKTPPLARAFQMARLALQANQLLEAGPKSRKYQIYEEQIQDLTAKIRANKDAFAEAKAAIDSNLVSGDRANEVYQRLETILRDAGTALPANLAPEQYKEALDRLAESLRKTEREYETFLGKISGTKAAGQLKTWMADIQKNKLTPEDLGAEGLKNFIELTMDVQARLKDFSRAGGKATEEFRDKALQDFGQINWQEQVDKAAMAAVAMTRLWQFKPELATTEDIAAYEDALTLIETKTGETIDKLMTDWLLLGTAGFGGYIDTLLRLVGTEIPGLRKTLANLYPTAAVTEATRTAEQDLKRLGTPLDRVTVEVKQFRVELEKLGDPSGWTRAQFDEMGQQAVVFGKRILDAGGTVPPFVQQLGELFMRVKGMPEKWLDKPLGRMVDGIDVARQAADDAEAMLLDLRNAALELAKPLGPDDLIARLSAINDQYDRMKRQLTGAESPRYFRQLREEMEAAGYQITNMTEALAAVEHVRGLAAARAVEEALRGGEMTRADLTRTANVARLRYEAMAHSGRFSAEAVQRAWQEMVNANVAALGEWAARTVQVFDGVSSALAEGFAAIVIHTKSFAEAFLGIWVGIKNALASVFQEILANFMKYLFTKMVGALSNARLGNPFLAMLANIPGLNTAPAPTSFAGLFGTKKAEGGHIAGPGTGTSDSIPALVSAGEYIIPAKQTPKYRPILEAMRVGKYAEGGLVAPRFADGGWVDFLKFLKIRKFPTQGLPPLVPGDPKTLTWLDKLFRGVGDLGGGAFDPTGPILRGQQAADLPWLRKTGMGIGSVLPAGSFFRTAAERIRAGAASTQQGMKILRSTIATLKGDVPATTPITAIYPKHPLPVTFYGDVRDTLTQHGADLDELLQYPEIGRLLNQFGMNLRLGTVPAAQMVPEVWRDAMMFDPSLGGRLAAGYNATAGWFVPNIKVALASDKNFFARPDLMTSTIGHEVGHALTYGLGSDLMDVYNTPEVLRAYQNLGNLRGDLEGTRRFAQIMGMTPEKMWAQSFFALRPYQFGWDPAKSMTTTSGFAELLAQSFSTRLRGRGMTEAWFRPEWATQFEPIFERILRAGRFQQGGEVPTWDWLLKALKIRRFPSTAGLPPLTPGEPKTLTWLDKVLKTPSWLTGEMWKELKGSWEELSPGQQDFLRGAWDPIGPIFEAQSPADVRRIIAAMPMNQRVGMFAGAAPGWFLKTLGGGVKGAITGASRARISATQIRNLFKPAVEVAASSREAALAMHGADLELLQTQYPEIWNLLRSYRVRFGMTAGPVTDFLPHLATDPRTKNWSGAFNAEKALAVAAETPVEMPGSTIGHEAAHALWARLFGTRKLPTTKALDIWQRTIATRPELGIYASAEPKRSGFYTLFGKQVGKTAPLGFEETFTESFGMALKQQWPQMAEKFNPEWADEYTTLFKAVQTEAKKTPWERALETIGTGMGRTAEGAKDVFGGIFAPKGRLGIGPTSVEVPELTDLFPKGMIDLQWFGSPTGRIRNTFTNLFGEDLRRLAGQPQIVDMFGKAGVKIRLTNESLETLAKRTQDPRLRNWAGVGGTWDSQIKQILIGNWAKTETAGKEALGLLPEEIKEMEDFWAGSTVMGHEAGHATLDILAHTKRLSADQLAQSRNVWGQIPWQSRQTQKIPALLRGYFENTSWTELGLPPPSRDPRLFQQAPLGWHETFAESMARTWRGGKAAVSDIFGKLWANDFAELAKVGGFETKGRMFPWSKAPAKGQQALDLWLPKLATDNEDLLDVVRYLPETPEGMFRLFRGESFFNLNEVRKRVTDFSRTHQLGQYWSGRVFNKFTQRPGGGLNIRTGAGEFTRKPFGQSLYAVDLPKAEAWRRRYLGDRGEGEYVLPWTWSNRRQLVSTTSPEIWQDWPERRAAALSAFQPKGRELQLPSDFNPEWFADRFGFDPFKIVQTGRPLGPTVMLPAGKGIDQVGQLNLFPRGPQGAKALFVSTVMLPKSLRRTGTGTMLYERALQLAKDRGFMGLLSGPDLRNPASNRVWDLFARQGRLREVDKEQFGRAGWSALRFGAHPPPYDFLPAEEAQWWDIAKYLKNLPSGYNFETKGRVPRVKIAQAWDKLNKVLHETPPGGYTIPNVSWTNLGSLSLMQGELPVSKFFRHEQASDELLNYLLTSNMGPHGEGMATGWMPSLAMFSPKSLIPSQPWVDYEGVASVLRGYEAGVEMPPIRVISAAGKRYVWDGHHRTTAALLTESPGILANMAELQRPSAGRASLFDRLFGGTTQLGTKGRQVSPVQIASAWDQLNDAIGKRGGRPGLFGPHPSLPVTDFFSQSEAGDDIVNFLLRNVPHAYTPAEDLRRFAPTFTPTGSIIPTQAWLSPDRIASVLRGLQEGASIPKIRLIDVAGKPYLWDGHHRTSAALMLGEEGLASLTHALKVPEASHELENYKQLFISGVHPPSVNLRDLEGYSDLFGTKGRQLPKFDISQLPNGIEDAASWSPERLSPSLQKIFRDSRWAERDVMNTSLFNLLKEADWWPTPAFRRGMQWQPTPEFRRGMQWQPVAGWTALLADLKAQKAPNWDVSFADRASTDLWNMKQTVGPSRWKTQSKWWQSFLENGLGFGTKGRQLPNKAGGALGQFDITQMPKVPELTEALAQADRELLYATSRLGGTALAGYQRRFGLPTFNDMAWRPSAKYLRNILMPGRYGGEWEPNAATLRELGGGWRPNTETLQHLRGQFDWTPRRGQLAGLEYADRWPLDAEGFLPYPNMLALGRAQKERFGGKLPLYRDWQRYRSFSFRDWLDQMRERYWSLGEDLHFAGGGHVTGPGTGTSDSIPAFLSSGEFVMPAKQTRQFRPVLEAMRRHAPRFQQGGEVGGAGGGVTFGWAGVAEIGAAAQTAAGAIMALGESAEDTSSSLEVNIERVFDALAQGDRLQRVFGNGPSEIDPFIDMVMKQFARMPSPASMPAGPASAAESAAAILSAGPDPGKLKGGWAAVPAKGKAGTLVSAGIGGFMAGYSGGQQGGAKAVLGGIGSGAMSGASMGFMMGGPIGAGIGALAGAAAAGIGALVGHFKKPVWKKAMENVGKNWGTTISEELAKKIGEDAKKIGDEMDAIILHTADIMEEAGGFKAFADKQGATAAFGRVRDLFTALERGRVTTKQVTDNIKRLFPEMAQVAVDATGKISESFIEITALAKKAGLDLSEDVANAFPEIAKKATDANGFVSESFKEWTRLAESFGGAAKDAVAEWRGMQFDKLAGAVTKMIGGFAKSVADSFKKAFKNITLPELKLIFPEMDDEELRKLMGEPEDMFAAIWDIIGTKGTATIRNYAQELRNAQGDVANFSAELERMRADGRYTAADFKRVEAALAAAKGRVNEITAAMNSTAGAKGMARLAEVAKQVQPEFDRLGKIVAVSIAAMIAAGRSPVEAINSVGESLDQLIEIYNKLKDSGLKSNPAFESLKNFRTLVKDNQAYIDSLTGVGDALVVLQNFGGLDQSSFNEMEGQMLDMKKKLEEAGFKENEILMMSLPTLKAIKKLHEENGMAISQQTEDMLTAANNAGIMNEGLAANQDLNTIMFEGLYAIIKAINGTVEGMPPLFDEMRRAQQAAENQKKPPGGAPLPPPIPGPPSDGGGNAPAMLPPGTSLPTQLPVTVHWDLPGAGVILPPVLDSEGHPLVDNELLIDVIAQSQAALNLPPVLDAEGNPLLTNELLVQVHTQLEDAGITLPMALDAEGNPVVNNELLIKLLYDTGKVTLPDPGTLEVPVHYHATNRDEDVGGVARGGLVGAAKVLAFVRGGHVPLRYLASGQPGTLLHFAPKGTDTVPAMLTPGEIVLNAAQQTAVARAITADGQGAVAVSVGDIHVTVAGSVDDPEAVGRQIAKVLAKELPKEIQKGGRLQSHWQRALKVKRGA